MGLDDPEMDRLLAELDAITRSIVSKAQADAIQEDLRNYLRELDDAIEKRQ
jgi:hypothetical protein